MDNLILEPTEKTLAIDFNARTGILEMKGVSYSDSTWLFFQDVEKWLEQYISDIGSSIVLNLKIQYLNSTSTKYLIDFIGILERYYEKGNAVQINWYYEKGDDMEEMGEEFSEEFHLPFKLICYD